MAHPAGRLRVAPIPPGLALQEDDVEPRVSFERWEATDAPITPPPITRTSAVVTQPGSVRLDGTALTRIYAD